MLSGAINAFNDEAGKGKNILNNQMESFAKIARQYKGKKIQWTIIGDNNYGEGSSREHAAMSPRLLGCVVVIAKSFARIHETNLKKQGILALTFDNPNDYDKIQENDKISIIGLAELKPQEQVKCIIIHNDESKRRNYIKSLIQ